MQFKTIVASLAALTVTCVVAGPVPEVNQDTGLVARHESLVAEPMDAPIVARGDNHKFSAQDYDDIKSQAKAFANSYAGQSPSSAQYSKMYYFYHEESSLTIWKSEYGNWNWPKGKFPQPIPQKCPPWGFWQWYAYYCQTSYPTQVNIWVNWHDDDDCLLGILCL